MVLVTADFRRRGFATKLVDACLDVAKRRGLTTWLDATPAGATVYGPLGFIPTLQLRRLRLTKPQAANATRQAIAEAQTAVGIGYHAGLLSLAAMKSASEDEIIAHCDTPTSPINVSGHEILAVRDLAAKFGQRFGRAPVITGKEEPTAWLTDTSQAVKLFGLPIVDTEQLISWTADWVSRSMPSLGKPTKYEVRDGRY
jgi:hypothetical protein